VASHVSSGRRSGSPLQWSHRMGWLVWRARKRNAGATAELGLVHGTTVARDLDEALPGKVAVRH